MGVQQIVDIPIELEREIFEIAAYDDPQFAPRLMLVARRVHDWIRLILFSVLRLSCARPAPLPLFDQESTKRLSLNFHCLKQSAPHIRHLLVQNLPVEEIAEILKYCARIENLALWILRGVFTPLIPTIANLRLRQLSFDPSCFFISYDEDIPIPFNQPMFHYITHLEIINVTQSWTKWKELSTIPYLSHLTLAGVVGKELIDNVLEECKWLKRLVIYSYAGIGASDPVGQLIEGNPRVVALLPGKDPAGQWERCARRKSEFL
ncbi:hypothetical protein M413DRAFT_24770 [Hebeloma cylindrosporum]|uniref:F-box domain-containing protein n=1 Tax=Hebeloma cylindrosporum TaxID=76867 RepID=A0A0C2Y707_HEBCY|nr:hypothetical protein M413DRAFT_24770 [Hebeloma cylindrosporum h7]